MKVALKFEADTYWLAGQVGVSERVHSSASDLQFTGDTIVDAQGRVRAASMKFTDRSNLSSGLSFSTWRKFDTTAEAEAWSAVYDAVTPRTGFVDLYGADGGLVARLTNAIVKPPTRKVMGVSVKIDYVIQGGAWLEYTGGGGGEGEDEDDGFTTGEITMEGECVTML